MRHNSVAALLFLCWSILLWCKIKFASHLVSGLVDLKVQAPCHLLFSSFSRLSAHLLFPLPCCYDDPALPSCPICIYLSIHTGKDSVQVERVQMILNDILIQRSTKWINSCWYLWILFFSWFVRYKNEELISPASDPTKYRIESKYGVHVLHINR